MPEYVYPQANMMREVGQQKIMASVEGDPLLALMPMVDRDESMLIWSQKDNYSGMQGLRGMDGSPGTVDRLGTDRYITQPGVFGEVITLGELELTNRAAGVQDGTPVSVEQLVSEAQDVLIAREITLMRYIAQQLFLNGTIAIPLPNGQVGFRATFPTQQVAGSDWSNPNTSTPVKDLRNIQERGTGSSVSFTQGSTALVNLKTANQALANQNNADLKGMRVNSGNTVNSIPQLNQLLLAQGLPPLTVYDETYDNGDGNQQNFIPDGQVVIAGQRTNNELIAEYRRTRNAANPNMAAGSYDVVIDKTGNGPDGQQQIPPKIEIHRGHNGGPVIFFGSAIINLSVGTP